MEEGTTTLSYESTPSAEGEPPSANCVLWRMPQGLARVIKPELARDSPEIALRFRAHQGLSGTVETEFKCL